MKISPTLLASLLALSACSKVNDMHDATMAMNATTAKMAANTSKMAETTEGMSKTTTNMNGVMTDIFDVGRQGAALDVRTKHWELVVNSPKLEDKGTYAGLYFLAFEFQLWANIGQDARPGERERLMADAANEFTRHLLGITHWAPEEIDPFAGKNPLKFGDVENEKASFNAVAASMEENNREQEFTATDTSEGAVSMLEMIETSLLDGKKIKEGKAKLEDFPDYENIVLAREELATRLLRARYQVMGLAVLGQLTPLTRNFTEGFKLKIWGEKWDMDFNQMTQSQIRLASFRIGQAIQARDTLAQLGIAVTLDPSIRKIYSHAQVKNLAGQKGALVASQESEAAKEQLGLINLLKDYTGSAAAK
ncbi:MAG: hypothetical protein ACXVC0_13500 [Bdellovibrionota bacterium]